MRTAWCCLNDRFNGLCVALALAFGAVPAPTAAAGPATKQTAEREAADRFRKLAPRILLLRPQLSGGLKIDDYRSIGVFLAVKNAVRQEGTFRIRTLEDLASDDEALHGYASVCQDDACLFEALADTGIGYFLRMKMAAQKDGSVVLDVAVRRVADRKSFRWVQRTFAAPAEGADVVEVIRSGLRYPLMRALLSVPPVTLLDGTAPDHDAAILVLAPPGSTIEVNERRIDTIGRSGMLRVLGKGGKKYKVSATMIGRDRADRVFKLAPSTVGVVELIPQRSVVVEAAAPTDKPASIAYGTVVVKMKVKQGADVFFDGEWVGENPLRFEECSPGAHLVVVRHPLFYRIKRTFTCVAGQTVNLAAEMLPRYGRIFVDSTVAGATVRLDGDPVGKTPLWVNAVRSGKHEVQILGEEWASKPLQFTMIEHRREKFFLKVRKRFGEVHVRGTPKGMTVSAKERKVRLTGKVAVLKVPPGAATVLCSAPFFRSVQRSVVVQRGKKVGVTCELEAVSARLTVTSAGQQGRVFVDGEVVSRLPAEVAIEPGEHVVRVEPDDPVYEAYQTKLTVAEKGRAKVTPVFRTVSGGLVVDSLPPGADVLLDGKVVGKTPFMRDDLPVGIFSMTVAKKGYNRINRRLVIAAEEVTKVRLKPLVLRGHLRLISDPVGAEIFVGGVSMGRTPLVLDDLAAGLYEVRAVKEGMAPRVLEIDVLDGGRKTVRFKRLIPTAQLNAPFVQRVRYGRLLVYGGGAAMGAGAATWFGGAMMVDSAPNAFEEANSRHNLESAREALDSARSLGATGRGLQVAGSVLASAGALGVTWFALRYPWGDL
jgi:hypothetical protein